MKSAQLTEMIDEADDFALNLLAMKAALSDYSIAANEIMSKTKSACSASLPRCWALDTEDPTGRAIPTRHNLSCTNTASVGGDWDEVLMDDAIAILSVRSSKILCPIDDWISTHHHAKARIERLEKLGKQIEASITKLPKLRRRHTMGGLEGQDEGKHGIEERKQLEHKALVQSWEENHQSITEQLTALIIDSSFVKSIVISLFVSIKESTQASLVALGPCKQPLPGYGPNSATDHGQVGGNDDLISSMPAVGESPDQNCKSDHQNDTRMVTSSPLQISTSTTPTPRYTPIDSILNPFALKLELVAGGTEGGGKSMEYRKTD